MHGVRDETPGEVKAALAWAAGVLDAVGVVSKVKRIIKGRRVRESYIVWMRRGERETLRVWSAVLGITLASGFRLRMGEQREVLERMEAWIQRKDLLELLAKLRTRRRKDGVGTEENGEA